jgi:hypothetical protein
VRPDPPLNTDVPYVALRHDVLCPWQRGVTKTMCSYAAMHNPSVKGTSCGNLPLTSNVGPHQNCPRRYA